jgi:hypothetical protein
MQMDHLDVCAHILVQDAGSLFACLYLCLYAPALPQALAYVCTLLFDVS